MQAPLWQESLCVQALPSVHAVPLALGGFEHVPVAELQAPARWHWSVALQTIGLAPMQVPLWQESLCVQALPSVHALPLGLEGFEHTPVIGLQIPATWHWSGPGQTIGLLPTQLPDWQVSVLVQA